MFVCICNGITDRGIRAALDGGARTPAAIYAYHDCAPQCFACEPEIAQAIKTYAREKTGPDELAGHPT